MFFYIGGINDHPRIHFPFIIKLINFWSDRRGRHRMVVKFQLPMQSVPIATNVVSEFELRSGEVYSIHHYVIKFVSDLRHGTDKLTATI